MTELFAPVISFPLSYHNCQAEVANYVNFSCFFKEERLNDNNVIIYVNIYTYLRNIIQNIISLYVYNVSKCFFNANSYMCLYINMKHGWSQMQTKKNASLIPELC